MVDKNIRQYDSIEFLDDEKKRWSVQTLRRKLAEALRRVTAEAPYGGYVVEKYKDLPEEIDLAELEPFFLYLNELYKKEHAECHLDVGVDSQNNDALFQVGELIVGGEKRVDVPAGTVATRRDIAIGMHNHPRLLYSEKFSEKRDPDVHPDLSDYFSFADFMVLIDSIGTKVPSSAEIMVSGSKVVFALRTGETPLYKSDPKKSVEWSDLRLLYRSFIFHTTIVLYMLGDIVTFNSKKSHNFTQRGQSYINNRFSKKFKIGLYVLPNFRKGSIAKRVK